MKIPRTLKIGGKKIKINIVNTKVALKVQSVGEWDAHYYTIELDNLTDAPVERMEECFLHEIMEAIDGFYELKLAHWKINLLGEVLYQIIKDNKLDFNS